jgi:hypothetical protein
MLMRSIATTHYKFLVICFILLGGIVYQTNGQIVVDGKDVSSDKEIHYIQFLYYVEKSSFKPVYLIDYGIIDGQQGVPKKQKVSIDKNEIKASMSPIYILNLLYKAGWEYMGDETYVQVPMMEGWYSFTLKRKK